MKLQLPDDILRRAEANETDLRIALALQLYSDNRIDHADACRLAGLDVQAFNRELALRTIGVHDYPRQSRLDTARARWVLRVIPDWED